MHIALYYMLSMYKCMIAVGSFKLMYINVIRIIATVNVLRHFAEFSTTKYILYLYSKLILENN